MTKYVAELTEDAFVYKTVLECGVATIPKAMVKSAEDGAKLINRQIEHWEGNFEETKAVFDFPISKEEADGFISILESRGYLKNI